MTDVVLIILLLAMLGIFLLIYSDGKKREQQIEEYNKALFNLSNVLKEITIENKKTKVEDIKAEMTITKEDETASNNLYNQTMAEWLGISIKGGDGSGISKDNIS